MSDAPHPTDVRVGRLLRERRLELGISQERLGQLLGITYQQIQKYERGTNRIGSSRMHELCGVLGVRASYFFDEPAHSGLAEAPVPFDNGSALPAMTFESRDLLDAFQRIGNADVRRRVVELVRTLAKHDIPGGSGGA